MQRSLSAYEPVVGPVVIEQLRRLGEKLRGTRIVHVNSTREGGGVAEILEWLVPLMQDVGLDASWEVLNGNHQFFAVTKKIHNGLHGQAVELSRREWEIYRKVVAGNVKRLAPMLNEADVVVIHDPQPAPLLDLFPKRRGKWIWRAHIDVSQPHRSVWKGLRPLVAGYDASIFSLARFAQALPHPRYIVPPSIDPLSPKNCELETAEIEQVRNRFGLDPERPLLVQVSRFDRMKDPIGVIQAYRLVRQAVPVQLVLVGGSATDDPEGRTVLEEVREAAAGDPDLHVLELPPTSHTTVNALQRLADIIVQKSIREGFGLTVAEGLWKGKPVIGGDTGGIRLQVVNHQTGFLVHTPEGAAHRIRYLLDNREVIQSMGRTGREFARENLLLTRHLREYLTLLLAVRRGGDEHYLEV